MNPTPAPNPVTPTPTPTPGPINTSSSSNNGGGGGGGGNGTNSGGNTGRVDNGGRGGGGGGGGGGAVDTAARVNDQELPADKNLEALFRESEEFRALEERFSRTSSSQSDPDVYLKAYNRAFQRWLGSQQSPGGDESAFSQFRQKTSVDLDYGSIERDADILNRKWSLHRKFRVNCQRIVAAWEARRRGYDVIANPVDVGWRRREYREATDDFSGEGVSFEDIANMWEDSDGNSRTWFEGTKMTRPQAIAEIEAEILSWGEGARGFIGVEWGGGVRPDSTTGRTSPNYPKDNAAHIFNVEVIGGNIVYIDAQYNVPGQTLKYGSENNWQDRFAPEGFVGVLRVDDLEPTPKVATWMRDATSAEINVPRFTTLVAEVNKPARGYSADQKQAFFWGWQAVRTGDSRTVPANLASDPALKSAFNDGLAWAEVPD